MQWPSVVLILVLALAQSTWRMLLAVAVKVDSLTAPVVPLRSHRFSLVLLHVCVCMCACAKKVNIKHDYPFYIPKLICST